MLFIHGPLWYESIVENMKRIEDIKKRIHNWYLGERVGMSDRNGIFISGHIDRPWLATAFDFVVREYKWVIGVLIALLMAYLAYRR